MPCAKRRSLGNAWGETFAACVGYGSASDIRFDLAGFCAKISGSMNFTFQDDFSTSGAGVPSQLTNNRTPSFQIYTKTYEATTTLATKRQTPLGELDTD